MDENKPGNRVGVHDIRILMIRGHRVMLDSDLSSLYGVETKVLLQAMRRNKERFPEDFVFRLTVEEFGSLRSQIVTSNGRGGGGICHLPSPSREWQCYPVCCAALSLYG